MNRRIESIERLAWQIAGKHDWRAIEEIEGWVYVYDHMPIQMRDCVHFKLLGYKNKEIAKIIKCTENAVNVQLNRAKKRFLRCLI